MGLLRRLTFPTQLERNVVDRKDLSLALIQVDIAGALFQLGKLDLVTIRFRRKTFELFCQVFLRPL